MAKFEVIQRWDGDYNYPRRYVVEALYFTSDDYEKPLVFYDIIEGKSTQVAAFRDWKSVTEITDVS